MMHGDISFRLDCGFVWLKSLCNSSPLLLLLLLLLFKLAVDSEKLACFYIAKKEQL